MEPRVKRRQTRDEWEKELKISGFVWTGAGWDGNKNENISGPIALCYAIYLLFDILIPKKAG